MFFTRQELKDRQPWNKGRMTGQIPLLKPIHVWAIRTRLQLSRKKRDLALFNLPVDSKLRACDLVRLCISDVALNGQVSDRATIRRHTAPTQFGGPKQLLFVGRPATFEPSNCYSGTQRSRVRSNTRRSRWMTQSKLLGGLRSEHRGAGWYTPCPIHDFFQMNFVRYKWLCAPATIKNDFITMG